MLKAAIIIAVVMFVADLSDMAMGDPMLRRPLVISAVVGLLLGDLTQGVIIGASLEVVFLGVTQIGGALPSDTMTGAIFGTAFSILSGSGTEVALSLAVPISILAVFINQFCLFVRGMLLKKFNDYIEEDNQKGIIRLHMASTFGVPLVYGVIGFCGIYFGANAVQSLVNNIPKFLMDGLTVASGLLPALGLALLLNSLWDAKIAVFMILGFVLIAYMNLPLIAIALIGTVIAVYTAVVEKEHKSTVVVAHTEGSEEEDFFNE